MWHHNEIGQFGPWNMTQGNDYHGTYSVTPDAHISTLKPENVSTPLAISGGWKAGDPWLVLQVSSGLKLSRR